MADEPRDRRRDFTINSPHYERCDDPDCSDAYAFRAPFPEVVHYHYIGPRTWPEPEGGSTVRRQNEAPPDDARQNDP